MNITDNFSNRVTEIFANAQGFCLKRSHPYLTPTHISYIIFKNISNNLAKILKISNYENSDILTKIENILIKIPKITSNNIEVKLDKNSLELISYSYDLARKIGDVIITEEILFLAIISLEFEVSKLFKANGLKENLIYESILTFRKGKKAMKKSSETTLNSLDKYSIDIRFVNFYKGLHVLA